MYAEAVLGTLERTRPRQTRTNVLGGTLGEWGRSPGTEKLKGCSNQMLRQGKKSKPKSKTAVPVHVGPCRRDHCRKRGIGGRGGKE